MTSNNANLKMIVFEQIQNLIENKSIVVSDDLPLIGDDSVLDSMKLVELCLVLEDKATEFSFEFDWTSEAAMSKSRSLFRTAGSLAAEFIKQKESHQ